MLSLLNNTATIYTTSYTTNAIGERVTSTTELGSTSCRLNRLSGKDQIYLDNLSTYITVMIFTPYRSDFSEWDEIEVDSVRYTIYSIDVLDTKTAHHHLEIYGYINKQR